MEEGTACDHKVAGCPFFLSERMVFHKKWSDVGLLTEGVFPR